jgi:hypothetical protein
VAASFAHLSLYLSPTHNATAARWHAFSRATHLGRQLDLELAAEVLALKFGVLALKVCVCERCHKYHSKLL